MISNQNRKAQDHMNKFSVYISVCVLAGAVEIASLAAMHIPSLHCDNNTGRLLAYVGGVGLL